jgi:hypothetical protein
MAPAELMTWNAKQKRWFFKFRKRQYAVSLRALCESYPHLLSSDTRAGSCSAANQWWREKLATLQHPQNAQLAEGIKIRQQLASWFQLEHLDELRAMILGEVDRASVKILLDLGATKSFVSHGGPLEAGRVGEWLERVGAG